MNQVQKIFDDEEKDLRQRLVQLTWTRTLFENTEALDGVFSGKKLYTTEQEKTIISVVYFKCQGVLKEALQKYFSLKFKSVALDRGHAVAVLGNEKQFTEKDKEVLSGYGLAVETLSTNAHPGNN